MSRGAWALCLAALLIVVGVSIGMWADRLAARQRELQLQREATWCVHDWQELAATHCPMAE